MAKRKQKQRRQAETQPSHAASPTLEPTVPPIVVGGALFVIAAFITLVRLRFLDLPLERDEGEYAYAGQLMLKGIPPYAHAYNMKWPGTYAGYALVMRIFGVSTHGIRMGLILITVATAVMAYFLAARLFGRMAGLTAAGVQAILSMNVAAVAMNAHATHFVAAAGTAGGLLLAEREGERNGRWRIFAAGVLCALATIMKQVGIFFVLCGALYLIVSRIRRGVRQAAVDTAAFAAGAAVTVGAMFVALAASGVFGRFWFWTVSYARQYASTTPLDEGLTYARQFLSAIVRLAPLPWIGAAIGLVALFASSAIRRQWVFVLLFVVACIAATVPGFHFRDHYFIVVFPAVASLCAAAVAAALRLTQTRSAEVVTAAVVLLCLIVTVAQQRRYLFDMSPLGLNETLNSGNPFPEAVEVGKRIRQQTAPSDQIAVIGSEPEIYFYADRLSATGYIYMYPLMEKQRFASSMQREMISEITRARPRYVVAVNVPKSWLQRPDSDKTIFQWSEKFVSDGKWTLDGIIDILPTESKYVWGDEAKNYEPKGEGFLMLFKRR